MRPLCQVVRHFSNAECINVSRSSYRVLLSSREGSSLFSKTANLHIKPQRFFSTQWHLRDKQQPPIDRPDFKAPQPSESQTSDPPVHHAPEEDLPSHREAQRWTISKRTHALMDNLMLRISVAAQNINKYTGTDYTGIEALRREIKDQGSSLPLNVKKLQKKVYHKN
jgi:hypothetical protein